MSHNQEDLDRLTTGGIVKTKNPKGREVTVSRRRILSDGTQAWMAWYEPDNTYGGRGTDKVVITFVADNIIEIIEFGEEIAYDEEE